MKKLILLLLFSVTFAHSNLMFKLFFDTNHSHGHHHNHYNYYHRYHPHSHLVDMWIHYYLISPKNKAEKTDKQILNELQRLYDLYKQGAITQQEYLTLKEKMLEELSD